MRVLHFDSMTWTLACCNERRAAARNQHALLTQTKQREQIDIDVLLHLVRELQIRRSGRCGRQFFGVLGPAVLLSCRRFLVWIHRANALQRKLMRASVWIPCGTVK